MINYLNISIHKQILGLLSILFAWLLFSGNLFAGNISLTWDASPSPDVGGYILSYGQSSGSYTSNFDVGNMTTYAVSWLPEGTQYYFAVKAYSSDRSLESSYSNEVSATIPTVIDSNGDSNEVPTISDSNNGLVAAYGFEEISGKAVADTSGIGNHGALKRGPVRISTGRYGKALKFDGMNDRVSINDSASLDLSTGMTLEAWVYPQSLTGNGNAVIWKKVSGGEVYSLYSNEDANLPVTYFNDGSYRAVIGPSPLPVKQWSHLVATYDGQVQRLYVNGIEVAESAQNGLIQQSNGKLLIGGNSIRGKYFKGYIDEVRIYNRALTETEVNTNLATAISVSNPLQFVLGNANEEPWVDFISKGTAVAFQAVAEKTGVMAEVKVYLDSTTTATELVAGIYKDKNGHPGARIAKGKLITLYPGAWNAVPIPVVSVSAGQPYWIAILGTNGQIGFLDQVGSAAGLMETSVSSKLKSLPKKWKGSVTTTNAAISVFGLGY